MPATQSNCPNGHRIHVGFAVGDNDELLYLRYACSDPTCDWCVVEFGPDECKEIVRIADDLLTHENYYDKSQAGGSDARQRRSRSDQPSLFAQSEENSI